VRVLVMEFPHTCAGLYANDMPRLRQFILASLDVCGFASECHNVPLVVLSSHRGSYRW